MQSILNALQETQSLIGGSLVSDSLNGILIGICDLVRQQQDDIKYLQLQIEHCATRDEIETSFKLREVKHSSNENQFTDHLSGIYSELNSLKADAAHIRKKFEVNVQQTDEVFQDFTQNINSDFQNRIFIVNEVMNGLQKKVKSTSNSFEEIKTDFSRIKDLFEQVGFNKIESLAEHLERIDNESIVQSEKVEELTSAIKKILNQTIERESEMKAALGSEISAMRSDIEEIQCQLYLQQDSTNNINIFESDDEKNKGNEKESKNKTKNEMQQHEKIKHLHQDEETKKIEKKEKVINHNTQKNNASLYDEFDSMIMPIVRAEHRNTRRIDGMNEQVSNVRMECENISTTMSQMQSTLEQFHHTIFDTEQDLEDTRYEFISFFHNLEEFLDAVVNSFADIWDIVLVLSKCHNHLSNSTSQTTDQIQNIFSSVITRPLPTLNIYDSVLVESQETVEKVNSKICGLNMHKNLMTLKTALAKSKLVKMRKTVPKGVEDYKSLLKPIIPSSIVRNANKVLGSAATGHHRAGGQQDPMIMIALEENRLKTKKMEETINDFIKISVEKINDISEKVNSKMEAKQADRVFNKLQQTIVKVQKNVDVVADTQMTNFPGNNLYFDEYLPSIPQSSPQTPHTPHSPHTPQSAQSEVPAFQMYVTKSKIQNRPQSRAHIIKEQFKDLMSPNRRPKTSTGTPNARTRNNSPNEKISIPNVKAFNSKQKMRLASSNVASPSNV